MGDEIDLVADLLVDLALGPSDEVVPSRREVEVSLGTKRLGNFEPGAENLRRIG